MAKFTALFVVLAILCVVSADTVDKLDNGEPANADVMSQAAQSIANDHCPYPDQYGMQCPIPRYERVFNATRELWLPTVMGFGYDPVTGQIKLPVLQLTYSGKKTWKNPRGNLFTVPDEVKLTPRDVNTMNVHTANYRTMAEMNAGLPFDQGVAQGGLRGKHPLLQQLFDQYFQGKFAMTLTSDQRAVFDLSMVNTTSPALDSRVLAALDYLPAKYDASLYGLFAQYWGTRVAISGSAGGMIEHLVTVKDCIYGVQNVDLSKEPKYDALSKMFPGMYPPGKLNPIYASLRHLTAISSWGGNPELAQASQWRDRIATLGNDAVMLDFNYIPIWKLVSHPAKRANLQRYDKEYMAAATAKRNADIAAAQAKANQPRTIHITRGAVAKGNVNYVYALGDVSMAVGQAYQVPWTLGAKVYITGQCTVNADGSVTANSVWPLFRNIGVPKMIAGQPVHTGCSTAEAVVVVEMGVGLEMFEGVNVDADVISTDPENNLAFITISLQCCTDCTSHYAAKQRQYQCTCDA